VRALALPLLAASVARAASPTALRCAAAGLSFAGTLTDHAVLQRAPQLASFFGCAGNASIVAGATVLVTFAGTEGGGGGAVNLTMPATVAGDGSWKITLLRAFATGGLFAASLACADCPKGSWWETIYNLTFGDVFVCAGTYSDRTQPLTPTLVTVLPPILLVRLCHTCPPPLQVRATCGCRY
jgi:hypothetical protein